LNGLREKRSRSEKIEKRLNYTVCCTILYIIQDLLASNTHEFTDGVLVKVSRISLERRVSFWHAREIDIKLVG